MFRFCVKDFQSLEDVRIDVSGLTLIEGESNAGKSACLRALQSACTNRFRSGQVRFGSDCAVIGVSADGMESPLYVKRASSGGVRIKFGDLVYEKLGRTIPSEVSEALNLGTLDLGGEPYHCNFHVQFSKPLLLEYSQSKVVELLSASSALEDLKLAKSLVSSESSKSKGMVVALDNMIATTRNDIKSKRSDLDELNKALICFEPLYLRFKDIKSKIDAITAINKDISNLSGLYTKIKALQNIVTSIRKYVVISSRIESVLGGVTCLRSISDIVQKCSVLECKVASLRNVITLRSKCNNYTLGLERCKSLRLLIERYADVIRKCNELEDFVVRGKCPICGNACKCD